MSSPDPFWTALSRIPSLQRTNKAWEQHFGNHFPRVKAHLRPGRDFLRSYPCPQPCGNGCAMSVRETKDGFTAFCPDEYQQAEPVDLDAGDVITYSLDIMSILRSTAKELGVAASTAPLEITRHTWHIGTVSLGSGDTLPVYFVLAMGRSTIIDPVRTILAPASSHAVFLLPDSCAIDALSQPLIDGNNSFVYSLNEIAKGLPGNPEGEIKPLASIIAGSSSQQDPQYMFQKEGKNWRLRWNGGPIAGFSDTMGFRHILILLENPYVDYSATELRQMVKLVEDTPKPGMAIKVAGDTRIAEWRQELVENQQEYEEAERNADRAKMESLMTVRQQLVQHVKECYGMSGRSRTVNDAGKNAKDSVGKALDVVHKYLKEEGLGEMSAYLRQTIRTGRGLCYHPPHPIHWNL